MACLAPGDERVVETKTTARGRQHDVDPVASDRLVVDVHARTGEADDLALDLDEDEIPGDVEAVLVTQLAGLVGDRRPLPDAVGGPRSVDDLDEGCEVSLVPPVPDLESRDRRRSGQLDPGPAAYQGRGRLRRGRHVRAPRTCASCAR